MRPEAHLALHVCGAVAALAVAALAAAAPWLAPDEGPMIWMAASALLGLLLAAQVASLLMARLAPADDVPAGPPPIDFDAVWRRGGL